MCKLYLLLNTIGILDLQILFSFVAAKSRRLNIININLRKKMAHMQKCQTTTTQANPATSSADAAIIPSSSPQPSTSNASDWENIDFHVAGDIFTEFNLELL